MNVTTTFPSTTTTQTTNYQLVMTREATGAVFTTWVFDNERDAIDYYNEENDRRNSDEFRALLATTGTEHDPMTLSVHSITTTTTVVTNRII